MHGLLVSVFAATALMLCRGMDTSTRTSTATPTTAPPTTVTTEGSRAISDDATATTVPSTYSTADTPNGDFSSSSSGSDSGSGAAVANSIIESKSSIYVNHDPGTSQNDKKCTYDFVNKNKYDPRSDKYDNVTEAMEKAFLNSPLAMHIFNKYIDPKASHPVAPAVLSPSGPVVHPNLLGNEPDHPVQPQQSPQPQQSQHPPTLTNNVKSPASSGPRKGIHKTSKFEDTDRDFDVNQMFNKISNNANGFSHPITRFSGVIKRDRRIGFDSNFLQDSSHKHFLDGFGSMFRRKKRMAVPPSPEVYNGQKPKSVCQSDRKVITAFVKGGDLCYLYRPQVQGIEMDRCKQEDCSMCSDQSLAKCIPQNLSAWVWAYCPGQGEVIMPEYIEYPAFCSCMVIQC